MNKVEKAEDYQPMIIDEDNEEAPPKRNPLSYIHGRLFLEKNGVWVFESFKNTFQHRDYPDIVGQVGKLFGQANHDYAMQQKALEDANNALKRSVEEKKLAAIEAAKKVKGKKKKGKEVDEVPSTPAVDETPTTPIIANNDNFDLTMKGGFESAMKARIGRPFIFGPVEFAGLSSSSDFDFEEERNKVISVLTSSQFMPMNTCNYGFQVKVKARNLKRQSSLLKHARFLKNLEVTACYPPIKEVVEEKQDEDEDKSD